MVVDCNASVLFKLAFLHISESQRELSLDDGFTFEPQTSVEAIQLHSPETL